MATDGHGGKSSFPGPWRAEVLVGFASVLPNTPTSLFKNYIYIYMYRYTYHLYIHIYISSIYIYIYTFVIDVKNAYAKLDPSVHPISSKGTGNSGRASGRSNGSVDTTSQTSGTAEPLRRGNSKRYGDVMVINGDFMGFYGDSWGFYGDL